MSEEHKPEEQKKSIQDNVLAAIKAGQVHMRPKWHYVLQTVLLVAGLILVFLASLFVGSFILFMLHQNGTWFAASFGGRGIRELFATLPIIFVLVAIVFIILVQILVRHYAFAYGKPMLYSVLAVLIIVVGGSFLIEQSHFHEGLFQEAREYKLPLAGSFYRQFGENENARVTPGVIIDEFDNGFTMEDPHEETVTIIITPNTAFPAGSDLEVNDHVIVLGNRKDDNILAEGIRKLLPNERYFPPVNHP
ncbi:MAG TPA: hypothetical protein VHQ20_01645 [Patescibacteria group bacterium]|jgi:hypothetical protein|nr:hypothetical protein [Patescibacteria group bacterium]